MIPRPLLWIKAKRLSIYVVAVCRACKEIIPQYVKRLGRSVVFLFIYSISSVMFIATPQHIVFFAGPSGDPYPCGALQPRSVNPFKVFECAEILNLQGGLYVNCRNE